MVALALFTGVDAVLAVVSNEFNVVNSSVAFGDCAMDDAGAALVEDVRVGAAVVAVVVPDAALLAMMTVVVVAALETFGVPVVDVT